MLCAQCRQPDHDTVKFCEECGARLISTCPNCGHKGSAAAKFCAELGATQIKEVEEPQITLLPKLRHYSACETKRLNEDRIRHMMGEV